MSVYLLILIFVVIAALLVVYRNSVMNSMSTIAGSNFISGGAENTCDHLAAHYKTLRRRISTHRPNYAKKTIIQMHYTDWCPHCIKMKPIWTKLAEAAEVDNNLSNVLLLEQNQDECNAPGITDVPQIWKQRENGEMDKYSGSDKYDDLYNWATS